MTHTATDHPVGTLETVATFDGPMPTGVTVSHSGRIFVNFPRWGDELPLAEAPDAYRNFDARVDGWTKVVLKPQLATV